MGRDRLFPEREATRVGAARFVVLLGLCVCRAVMAQVPETGRWQNLVFTAHAVHESTATRYHEILSDLAAKGTLDDSRLMSTRVRQVAAPFDPDSYRTQA